MSDNSRNYFIISDELAKMNKLAMSSTNTKL